MTPLTTSNARLLLLPMVLWLAWLPDILGQNVPFEYHNYTELTEILQEFHQNYSDITHLYSIGQSVKGRELWVIAISDNPTVHEIRETEVHYIANMHGNEVVGMELLLHLLAHLTGGYGQNSTISSLVNSTRVHLLPSMNPDGLVAGEPGLGQCRGSLGRYNANFYDLNRNFPDKFQENLAAIQPETQAVMNWTRSIPFSLAANLHGGALVANYPWDNYMRVTSGAKPPYHRSPDDDIYRHLTLTYSKNHHKMHKGNTCPPENFEDGITNGVAWYPIKGSMQDWIYVHGECLSITLEVSCCKYPTADKLSEFWDHNQDSLMALLLQAHRGVKGRVFIKGTETPVAGATVIIGDRNNQFHTTADGEYWRILLSGMYDVTVTKEGFRRQTKTVIVPANLTFSAEILDFHLVQDDTPTTSAPTTTITTPITTTSVPITTTSTPITTTSTTMATTSTPITTTSAPITTTSVPVTTTSAPITTTSAPITTTSAPITTTSAPITTTSAPITTTSAPITTSSAPVTTTTSAPITTTSAPITTTSAPITTSSALVTTSSAPVTTTTSAEKTSAAAPVSISVSTLLCLLALSLL